MSIIVKDNDCIARPSLAFALSMLALADKANIDWKAWPSVAWMYHHGGTVMRDLCLPETICEETFKDASNGGDVTAKSHAHFPLTVYALNLLGHGRATKNAIKQARAELMALAHALIDTRESDEAIALKYKNGAKLILDRVAETFELRSPRNQPWSDAERLAALRPEIEQLEQLFTLLAHHYEKNGMPDQAREAWSNSHACMAAAE